MTLDLAIVDREPTPPSEFLRLLIHETPGMTPELAAQRMGVDRHYVTMLMTGVTKFTPECAILLSKVFDVSPELWLNMQQQSDLYRARRRLQAEGRL